MRCASWRSSTRPNNSRSSGWPMRMICSSFWVSVSRLVSSRTCSSTSGARFCASSTTSTMRLPSACALSRWRLSRSTRSLRLRSEPTGTWSPSSSQMASRNSAGVMRGFRISAISACLRRLRQQRANYRGLARAHFARELDEAAGLVDAIHQVRERLRVPFREEQVTRVGGDRERLLVEAEKGGVHGYAVLCWIAAMIERARSITWVFSGRHRQRLTSIARCVTAAGAARAPFRTCLRRLPPNRGPRAARCRGGPPGCRTARG